MLNTWNIKLKSLRWEVVVEFSKQAAGETGTCSVGLVRLSAAEYGKPLILPRCPHTSLPSDVVH